MATLKNKVIVITGAAGRLGRHLVQRFAEEGAVIAAVVRDDEEARSIPFPENAEGWAFPVDVTDEELVKACFRQIGDQFSSIDAVVHTVGGWESRPLAETSLEAWNNVMTLNLTSAFLCFREALPLMKAGGRLIGMSSGQGADGGRAEQAAYSAAKAGIVRLVEAVTEEYRGTGITAHAVAPSMILFDGDGEGVSVHDIVEICRSIIAETGNALNGATIKAYGSA
ncbi:MAG: SDR family oxidoreductase [Rhodothermales bacterium]